MVGVAASIVAARQGRGGLDHGGLHAWGYPTKWLVSSWKITMENHRFIGFV